MKKDTTKVNSKQLTEERVREIALEEIQKELKRRKKAIVLLRPLA